MDGGMVDVFHLSGGTSQVKLHTVTEPKYEVKFKVRNTKNTNPRNNKDSKTIDLACLIEC